MKRFIHIFSFLFICCGALAQCEADFLVSKMGSEYQFTNISTLAQDDEITSRVWRFGDGNTTTNSNPSHTYVSEGQYDVILQISTAEGCTSGDTMQIEVCSFSLDFNLSPVCDDDGFVPLNLEVIDNSGDLDSIMILLDDIPVSDQPILMTQNVINYNIKVPGDGNQHQVRVVSLPNGFCSETISFLVQDCNASCFLTSLMIDDGYQETHNIVLLEDQFSPSDRVINLGDKVRFIWLDDGHSSTSEDTISSDKWDSGVQDSSFIFEITPKNPGLKPFYSTPDGEVNGDYSGNLIANCPDSRGSLINLTFFNTAVPPDGFYVAIDGVILKDTTYDYNILGITNLEFFLPGDGKTHQISIVDVEDETCTLKGNVKAINCDGFFECSLNVNAQILERCNEDSLVLVGVDVSTIRPTDLGVLVVLDDTLVMDTIYYIDNQANTEIQIFGDGLVHTIKAIDLTDTFCLDEVFVQVNDCAAQCSIDELQIGTGSNNTIVLAVTNELVSLQNLIISSGDDVLWQWIQDSLTGVRSFQASGPNSWDSGLLTDGDIFISPILTAGIHPYFLYNEDGDTLYSASIEVIASCDENKIPVFYNFFDVNGSLEGYDIYVDSIRLESGPYDYALDGNNRGVFQLEGDDLQHLIEIRDLSEMGCFAASDFVAPTCEVPPCGGLIELLVQDSCYNDNTINFLATVSHPQPTEQGFIFRINGDLYEGFPFFYGANGETMFTNSLLADSSIYTFTYVDLADPECVDTLIYQSPLCDTDCELRLISTQLVDSLFLIDNPNTPDSLVGCQDSFINVAVVFNEQYSDSDSFRILVDSVWEGTVYGYKLGDGVNTIFVSVKGDDDFHNIQFIDHQDSACTFTTEVYTPMCFSPCNIEIAQIVTDSCINEIGYYTLLLDTLTNKLDYQVYYDGDSIEVMGDSLEFSLSQSADGLSHYVLVEDKKEPLCKDSIFFTAAYCLDCPLDIHIVQRDSCEIGDSIGYGFIFNPAMDSLDVNVVVGDTAFTINPKSLNYTYDIRLRGDSTAYQYIFTSAQDMFCRDTFDIQTIDCTPIICDPAYVFDIDGLTITFTDSSITSEPIIDQSWSINDIINIGNVSTFNYTVDSIGLYEICHSITTDSCSSTICNEILVGDPCSEVIPFYTYMKVADGYQFTNMSVGTIDEYLYRFGDGIFSNSTDPFHVYPDTGQYETCLIVRQEEFDCQEEYCEIIDVVLNSNKNIITGKKLKVYPNPTYRHTKSINFEFDGNTKLTEKQISISNIQGQRWLDFSVTSNGNSTYNITMNKEMSSGVYMMSISEGSHTVTARFVVY